MTVWRWGRFLTRILGGLGLFLPAAVGTPLPVAAAAQEPRQEQEKEAKADVPVPLPKGKRLVLKNGSFHIVRSYEVRGDRVRYYSTERSVWEELPADLVDWEATRAAEAEDAARRKELLEKTREIQARENLVELDVDASIEVAPGVFLPEGDGAYVVQGRQVEPLGQVGADLKRDKGRVLTQIFVPVVPTRHKVMIAGKRAALRLATGQPEFYVRTADGREPEIELIRAEVKGDARQIELLYTYLTGEQSAKRRTLSLERWRVAKGVYRLTLSESLPPGEYVLAEILPGEGMNLFVWDFGIDPSRPERGAPARPRK
jgi:hypothetical protein